MKKKHLLSLATTTLIVLAGCSSQDIATSKHGNVTKEELYNAMKKTAGQSTLYTLLVEKVASANLKDKAEVEKQVKEFITTREASAGGTQAFEELIKKNGYSSIEEFKSVLYNSRMIAQVIKENITITDEEIAKAYETYSPKIKASHILVADEAAAKDIIAKLNNGGDWNALAKEFSTDTANKDNGGSLGEFDPSKMVAEFATAAKTMKNGEISKEPVKTSFGYHVIKMENNPEKKSLEEEKEAIKNNLLEKKVADQSTQQEILNKLLQNADVKVNDTQLKEALSAILNPQTKTEN